MALQRHGMGCQRITPRLHPPVGQKLSVLSPANGILKTRTQVKQANYA